MKTKRNKTVKNHQQQSESGMCIVPSIAIFSDHYLANVGNAWLRLSRYSIELMYFTLLLIIRTGVHVRAIVDC